MDDAEQSDFGQEPILELLESVPNVFRNGLEPVIFLCSGFPVQVFLDSSLSRYPGGVVIYLSARDPALPNELTNIIRSVT